MVCPSCGTPSSNSFKFCPECGARFVAAPAGSSPANGGSASPAARVDEAAQAARLLDQAFELYDGGQYDEALGCCQAALALDPEGSTAHSLLGMIYERLGKTTEAVQQYQFVLQMNPESIADAIKLETLVSRSKDVGRSGVKRWLKPGARLPAVAGALVAVAALVGGIWATSRAGGAGSASLRRVASRSPGAPIPGASLPPSAAPVPAAPGAAQTTAPTNAAAPVPSTSSTAPGAAATAGQRPAASVPAPPPPNSWPAPQHSAYPPARPIHASPGAFAGSAGHAAPGRHGPSSGYLAPAQIQGIERIEPNQPVPATDMPGPSLPATVAASPRSRRGSVPVLPSISTAGSERPPAPPQPAAAVPAAPPSASINIQPLDDSAPAAPARAAQPAAPPARAPSLAEALQHQQMAAYYRRQGDDQAAYGEYQSARELFLRIQQRGGRDAAVAAQGAAAAQYGMSRLQGP